MTGKRDRNEPAADTSLAEQVRAVLAMTEGLDAREAEQRGRAAFSLIRAAQAKQNLDASDAWDERLDAAGEQELRDELLRRLDALEAEILEEEAAARAGTGPSEPVVRGLEWLVAQRAKAP